MMAVMVVVVGGYILAAPIVDGSDNVFEIEISVANVAR